MEKLARISVFGEVPALQTIPIPSPDSPADLLVGHAPYNRFAVVAADDGMDTFGLRKGEYAVFREQRYPTNECQICLVTFGEEVTIRMLEYIHNDQVTLRVSGDKIPPEELAPTDFQVIGVLDGVVLQEFAQLVLPQQLEFDWGC